MRKIPPKEVLEKEENEFKFVEQPTLKLAGTVVTDCRVVGATIGKVAFEKTLFMFLALSL